MLRRVLVRTLLVALLAVVAAVASDCAKRHHISVQSDSCWILVIDRQQNSLINDCGSSNYRVAGEVHCVALTNLNDIGFVRVRIDDGAWVENSTPRGTAANCR